MASDLPDYHLPRVVLIDHVELVDLISEITLIKTIQKILSIDEVTLIKTIEKILSIDEITEITHITGLGELTHVTSLDTVGKVWLIKSLAHANVTENLVKNATIDNYWDIDSEAYLIKDWILLDTEVVDTLGGVEGEGWADILAGGYIKQYLKPNYGDECAFLIWVWSQYSAIPIQVTFIFSDDTTEVFNFTTTAGTKTSHLCELTTHKRLKSVTIANTHATYSYYVDEIDGIAVPVIEAVVSATDLDIRDLTATDIVTVKSITDALPAGTNAIGKLAANSGIDIGDVDVITMPDVKQSNETLLKATVTQAAKDRTVTGTVSAEQIDKTKLNANVFTKHDNKTYKTAVFDASASGNLVAAVADKVIKLHALTIQAQGTVVVNLNNGSGGASLMEWSFQAREGAVVPIANAPAYWAITGVNTALYVTLSAAVVVTITAIYSDDDAS